MITPPLKNVQTPIVVFGDPVQENALEQMQNVARDERVVAAALMADHHKGYSMPIGGVAAYEDAISPSGVGFDIACGNKAVRTKLTVEDFGFSRTERYWWADDDPEISSKKIEVFKPIMREIQKRVAFGMGRTSEIRVGHELFEQPVWREIGRYDRGLKQKAEAQLGTVGSGNHYVDLLVSSKGELWIANHFGSRGLGHTVATGVMNLIDGNPWNTKLKDREEPYVVPTDSDLAQFYIAAMELAGAYAYAGRDHVISQVLEILGTEATQEIHNHHNFAWLEDGKWVVRKGATPLTDQPAFIGGSMGEGAAIVRGTGEEIGAIASAPHGAGRVMSRSKARGKIKTRTVYECSQRDCTYRVPAKEFKPGKTPCAIHGEGARFRRLRVEEQVSKGVIDWDATRADLTQRGIVVLGAGADEAPGVYKSLGAVLAQHTNIDVLAWLEPVGVVMAGPNERDPYKD